MLGCLNVETLAQLEVSGQEIGVEVGQSDVADRRAPFFRGLQVDVDVAAWIDDDRGLRPLVDDQVGGLGQTAEVELLEDHHVPSGDRTASILRAQPEERTAPILRPRRPP